MTCVRSYQLEWLIKDELRKQNKRKETMTEHTENIQCWACFEKGGEIKSWEYQPRPLGPDDVEISITHCGICGSDIHQIDGDWGASPYPIVPGHEIVGHVTSVGTNVTEFKSGDRVGVGAQAFSCLNCEECHEHNEPYCTKKVWTYASHYDDGEQSRGGYAKAVRVHKAFTFAIPDNLPSESVAPLLCAGITVFSPMLKYGVTQGTKLGVIGIGGLGHLGVKFGKALGAHVVAISHSQRKKADALELGADEFICTDEEFKTHARSLDIIVSTANNKDMDFLKYLRLLKTDGRIVLVGIPETPFVLHASTLIGSRLSISGSAVGSPDEIRTMLKLASEKNVLAKVQVFDISDVNEAVNGVRDGKPNFRHVLKIQ